MSQKYSVGDILYVVPARDMGILALRVEEELVRKTLDGETITYMASNGQGSVSLADIQGFVFRTPAECREFLMSKAIASIDLMIEKAVQTSRERFARVEVQYVPPQQYDASME
jgi:hypothetical protein